MSRVLGAIALGAFCACAGADIIVYSQPPNGTGTLYQSSWWSPDDSDWDIYSWDSFTLSSSHAITEVTWRGGLIYGGGYGGPVVDFTVAIYPTSIANEPDVVNGPLVEYTVGDHAGETYAGTFGGTAMYDYHYTLPSPFQAEANTKYWLYIVAWQNGIPEWGFSAATGGNGSYFRYVRGYHQYQFISGDFSFSLTASDAPTHVISASPAPPEGGTIQGAGAYPDGSLATLTALPSAGWGLDRWTENSATVSLSNPYSFVVTQDRDLVANFVPAYTISTSAAPTYGGDTTGAGVYNEGTMVRVEAAAFPQFQFVNWTEFGVPVSSDPVYTFAADAGRALVANFALRTGARAFDFDDAPAHTSLPIDLTEGGLTAHFSATGFGYSIRPVDELAFVPAGFSGQCVFPDSLFAADLIVDLSTPITSFSILYSPEEFNCDDSATMRTTGYLAGVFVATRTTTVSNPGYWPTGTLTLDDAGGFDRVVLHYDAPPPTCQDYLRAFTVDNMVVTMAPGGCVADLNGDGAVDLADLSVLLANFGTGGGATHGMGDLNGDGAVDLADLADLLVAFGGSCG